MADIDPVELDPTNETDDVLEEFDETTDEEMEKAGDDPAKLKELIKSRTETRQRLYARLKAKEADLKALKGKDDPTRTSPKQQKSNGKTFELGYDHKAYLVANGIKGNDEFSVVQEVMQNTGKSLDEVIEMRYVQAELKALREEKATAYATPRGDKVRGGKSAQNTVEYWIAKGELPPADQTDLRRKVVAEKVRMDSTHNKFGGR